MAEPLNPYLKEARAFDALGLCNDANRHFDKALLKEPDNIPLIIEAAGARMAQGLMGECHAMISALDARLDRDDPSLDPEVLALMDTLVASSTFMTTVKLKEPLRRALEAFTKHGLGVPIEGFSKRIASPSTKPAPLITSSAALIGS